MDGKSPKKFHRCLRGLHFRAFFGVGILFCLIPFLTGCSVSGEPVVRTGFYFDTVIQITLYDRQNEKQWLPRFANHSDMKSMEDCLDECFAMAADYEKMLSPSIEGSDIWKINHSGGKPVTVSEETAALLQTALSYCEMTDGRVDITIEPVNELWDFHTDNSYNSNHNNDNNNVTNSNICNSNADINTSISRIPSKEALAEAACHVDYHNLLIEGNTVTLLDSKSAVSLGFIAKGFIADKMKEYLLAQNIESGIINLGGNLLAVGSRPDGTPFQFGIQKPFDTQGTPVTVLSVSDKSAVSSGVYERYFYEEDVLYHHILNPATGYPVQNHLLGVTILSDSSMIGDALSTTCFVLGLEDGMELIESLDDVEGVFITEDEALHYSSGVKPIP